MKKLLPGVFIAIAIPAFFLWLFIGETLGIVFYIISLPWSLVLKVPIDGLGDALFAMRNAVMGPAINGSLLFLLGRLIDSRKENVERV